MQWGLEIAAVLGVVVIAAGVAAVACWVLRRRRRMQGYAAVAQAAAVSTAERPDDTDVIELATFAVAGEEAAGAASASQGRRDAESAKAE